MRFGRERQWLTTERLRLWASAAVAVNVLLIARQCLEAGGLWFLNADGTRRPYDFLAFRAAGELALQGRAAEAYDLPIFLRQVAWLMGVEDSVHLVPWVNPPNFLLVHTPLATLPYNAAFLVWLLLTTALYAFAFRAALPIRLAPLYAFAAPVAAFAALLGQSSFLSAALLALGFAMLPARPFLAGLLLGCLSFKPNLGIVLPFVLAAGHHWRAFLGAAAAVLLLILGSAFLFGTESWWAYLQNAGTYADYNMHDRTDGMLRPRWPHAQSFYNFALGISGSARVAGTVHAAIVVPAIGLAVWLWWRGAALPLKAASAIAATFLASPYIHGYDALMLAVAAAFLARHGLEHGFLPGDRIGLLLAFLLPGGVLFLSFSLFAPASALILLAIAVRQAVLSRPPVRAA